MLNNKVIVVTGGAGRLGKEFIKTILENNGVGILADINPQIDDNFIEIVKIYGEKFEANKLDITNLSSITELINFVVSKHGKIDALVNNAYPRNKNYGRIFEEVEYEDFCENLNMHLGGYFLTSQQFYKYFRTVRNGNIINISSIYGVIPPRFEIYAQTELTTPVEYAVIKSSIIHFTKYLAKYSQKQSIRVNSISPGGILDKQPLTFIEKYNNLCLSKGMLNPNDISGVLLFLLSDYSKYVNGQNIVVDDGFTL